MSRASAGAYYLWVDTFHTSTVSFDTSVVNPKFFKSFKNKHISVVPDA